MPLGLDPEMGLIMFLVGGIGTLVSFTAFGVAQDVGPKLTINDLRPSLPWEGLPLPRFMYTKPELIEELKRRGK
ncbi:unnamed protein product [marine sediment metagenome]|uniref:Uncharacterized protein n=1 Tax=marine sediment metagenome TaxID=412755 RepID=X1L1V2_9ZZZZ